MRRRHRRPSFGLRRNYGDPERAFRPTGPGDHCRINSSHDQGLVVAFASGRGKSLGSALRSVLPSAMAAETIIGYYNGGHIRMASVDINTPGERPEPDPSIAEAVGWIEAQPEPPSGQRARFSGNSSCSPQI